MEMSKTQIDKFREIYRKRFGVTLDNKDIKQIAEPFLHLVGMVFKPIRKSEIDDLNNRH